MKPNFDGIPQELKERNQWCLWKLEKDKKGKPTKVPYQTNGYGADTTKPTTWTDYKSVCESFEKSKIYSGIGFIFSENDPYIFIDLDHCIVDGNIEQWALDILQSLSSYSESSQSGLGIHSIIKGSMNGNTRHRTGNFEIYDKERYCAITGNRLVGYPIEIQSRQNEIDNIYNQIFTTTKPPEPITNTNPISAETLIQKIKKARNGAKFDKLMSGDHSDYQSQSEAESALAWIIAFYTHDFDVIESIMRLSAFDREKWDKNKSYLKTTIQNAIDGVPLGSSTARQNIAKQVNEIESSETKGHALSFEPKTNQTLNTDLGNAELLVTDHGDNIRYCYKKDTWFIWNEKYWQEDGGAEIQSLAKLTVKKMYLDAFGNDAKAKHAISSQSDSRIRAMIHLSQSEKGIPVETEELDMNINLLNCQNGTLDLVTGELLPHTREDVITKIIPVTYDIHAECSRWRQFLDEIFMGDKELIQFIQYALGYSLTGSIQERCMFIAYGNGANGKSKFLDTIEYIMGDYSRHVEPSTFAMKFAEGGNAREDIARLYGARFISSIETSASHRLDEELIKKMTGDRKITTRNLYERSFEFVQTYKMWLATNNKPIIKGTDDGIWDRIRLIPFERKFAPEERDGNLYEKLIAESSGILNWMLDGCLLWNQRGLHAVTPEKVLHANEEYRTEMNTLQAFIDDCCIIEGNAVVTSKELYQAYVEWCLANGEKSESQKMFGMRLKGLKYNITLGRMGGGKGNMWKGIGIRNLF